VSSSALISCRAVALLIRAEEQYYRLLQTLLPLLAQVPSSLRSVIRHTILTDLKTSNAKTKNHRLNRIVQSLLFGMIENGMHGEVVGDKGKGKAKEKGGEAMWAVMMVRELWKKGVWCAFLPCANGTY